MKDKSIIIAHRGESFDAPENTIASVSLAIERGADAVEIDAQLSQDNRIVVFHDNSTLRIGGRFKRVANQTYKQLLELDAGNHKGIKWTGEKIPLLNDVLDILPHNTLLLIELKGKNPFGSKLLELKNSLGNNIIFISFNLKLLDDVKLRLPHIPVFLIYERNKSVLKNSTIEKLIIKCSKHNLDGLDLDYRLIKNKNDVQKIKKAGLKLFVWTVDEPKTARRLIDWGVDGITTNRAAWLKEKLFGEK